MLYTERYLEKNNIPEYHIIYFAQPLPTFDEGKTCTEKGGVELLRAFITKKNLDNREDFIYKLLKT